MHTAWRVVALGVMMLSVVTSCSCSRQNRGRDGTAPEPVPVTIQRQTGWVDPGIDPETLRMAAGSARDASHKEVADELEFYARLAETAADIVLTATTADASAVLAIRRHADTKTPSDTVVSRLVDDVRAQGGVVESKALQFHGVAAWQVEFTAAPSGLRDVTYWFDRGSGRFSVEILGVPDDVAALADAVRIS